MEAHGMKMRERGHPTHAEPAEGTERTILAPPTDSGESALVPAPSDAAPALIEEGAEEGGLRYRSGGGRIVAA